MESSRPLQFIKCVCFIPSSFALWFIWSTKACSEPATYSAMATAASLALATLIHLIMVSTVCVSPGSRNTCEPPMDAAYSLTETASSRWICPFSSASKISSRVMIFVILAGISSLSFSFSYKIRPLLFSIKTADCAVISIVLFSSAFFSSCA